MVRLPSLNNIAIWLALTCVFAPDTLASTPHLLGFGARAIALSGGVVSDPEGTEAVYYNPAGLAFGTSAKLKLGFQFSRLNLDQDGRSVDVPNAMATTIGVALPLAFGGFLRRRIAIGAGFVIPTNTVLTASLPAPSTPHFPIVGHRAQTVTLMGTLAVRIVDGWTLGGGVLALSALKGRIAVAPNAEGRVGSSAKNQLVAAYAPIIGTAVHTLFADTKLTFGLVFRGASTARFDLPVTADLGPSFPLDIPRLNIEGVAQYDPSQLDAEIAMRTQHIRLSTTLNWSRWSRFPQPIEYAVRPDELEPLPPPGLTDSWAAGIGAEYTANHGPMSPAIRGSYRWVQTPVPSKHAFHNFLDNHRHVFGVGAQLVVNQIGLAVAGQYGRLQRRHTALGNNVEDIEHGGAIWTFCIDVEVRP